MKRDSRRIIETILIRYPMRKREYEEYTSDIIWSIRGNSEGSSYVKDKDYIKPQSMTEAKALKMNGVYEERMKKEIEAVEMVYNNLNPEEQKLIKNRYWNGTKKPVPYLKLKECNYSERQAKRIVFKVMYKIGKILGEVN